jgi:hypothetical protein
MLRVAMDLDDYDVLVLREAVCVQGQLLEANPGEITLHRATTSWEQGNWRKLGLLEADLDSTCGKLQSLGLLMRLESRNNQNVYAPISDKYLLMRRGLQFVNAVRQREGDEHQPDAAKGKS